MSIKIFSVLVFVCINTVVCKQPIYVEPRSLDFSTYLVAPHDICNEISCISVNELFFIKDTSIACPVGHLPVAYTDQAGKYRVASVKTNKARRSIQGKKLVENCERLGTTPHYMSPTISSLQKVSKKNQRQQQPQHTTTLSTATQSTTTTMPHMPLDLSSILTNDETFFTVKQPDFETSISFKDIQYLNNKFPNNLFDDRGELY